MKHLLIRISAGLLVSLMASVSLPVGQSSAVAQPSSGNQILNSPLLRGVTLTAKQQAQLLKIRKDTDAQVSQLLTPEQRKIVATQGAKAVKLSTEQQTKYMQIAKASSAKVQAIFTPAQLKQIQANLQAMQAGSTNK